MQGLVTQKYAPSDELLEIIDDYWSIENNTTQTVEIPIVPDGCMDIIYKCSNEKDEILLVGAMDKTIISSIEVGDYYFGIRFKPAYLSFLIMQSMNGFSNKIISLKDINKELFNKLNFTQNDEEHKVERLNEIFEAAFSKITIDERIIFCIDLVLGEQGDISVEQIITTTNLQQKQIERLSLYHLGYSLKKFIGVVRFYNAHQKIIKEGLNGLNEIACNFGYCDQSHFNKEHKKFTNFSPSDENMSILYNTKS